MKFEEKAGFMVLLMFAILGVFMPYNVYDPIKAESVGMVTIYARLISLTITTIILLTLTYYIAYLYKKSNEIVKPQIFDILMTLLLITIAMIIGYIGPLDLLLYGNTGVKFYLFGEKYIDPISIGVGTVCLNMAFYFYYIFSKEYTASRGRLDRFVLILYAFGNTFIIYPDNNYSNAVEPVTFIKIASRVFLFLGMLIPVLLMIIGGYKRLKSTLDKVMRGRIYLLIISNVLLLIVLIFNVIDALTPIPYSSAVIVVYILQILGIIGIGISVPAPNWFVKFIQRF